MNWRWRLADPQLLILFQNGIRKYQEWDKNLPSFQKVWKARVCSTIVKLCRGNQRSLSYNLRANQLRWPRLYTVHLTWQLTSTMINQSTLFLGSNELRGRDRSAVYSYSTAYSNLPPQGDSFWTQYRNEKEHRPSAPCKLQSPSLAPSASRLSRPTKKTVWPQPKKWCIIMHDPWHRKRRIAENPRSHWQALFENGSLSDFSHVVSSSRLQSTLVLLCKKLDIYKYCRNLCNKRYANNYASLGYSIKKQLNFHDKSP